MNPVRVLRNVLSFLFLLTTSAVVIAGLGFSLFKMFSSQKDEESMMMNEYQTLWFSSTDQHFRFGSSYIPEDLKEGEFVHRHHEEEDLHSLISRFGEEEFICTGNCYCVVEENTRNDRRSLSSAHHLPRRLLTYLLVSVSLSEAYILSKKYFEESCKEELRSTCSEPTMSIESEVSDCEGAYSFSKDFDGFELDDTPEGGGAPVYDKIWRFQCKGPCVHEIDGLRGYSDLWGLGRDFDEVKRDAIYNKLTAAFESEETVKYDCNKMKLEKEIVLEEDKLVFKTNRDDIDTLKLEFNNDYLIAKAHFDFLEELDKFCKDSSPVIGEELKESLVIVHGHWQDLFTPQDPTEYWPVPKSWCKAHPFPVTMAYSPPQSREKVKCRRIEDK